MENEFYEKLQKNPLPVVVDFWAPWCGPCRAMEPVVKELGEDYNGRVDLWKVNADEQPDLVRSLRIYGIPTMVAFRNGREVARRTGAASPQILSTLFDAAMTGEQPKMTGLSVATRLLRLGFGLALVGLAVFNGSAWWSVMLAVVGGIIMFSAVYDRCPVYRALSERWKELFQKDPADSAGS